ncbi:uncharacterized protein KGF55_004936 [Candida pseudojiufengensis]|uniref:uncharacterized protein n=1 Tax=Candida pseudojiufengensis TaxID=497109 RepID=UPI002224FE62|nr:uncharacterized protein KGF55_004936 [Candida pseudojiufengensis]KAI5960213.1 hypothetical protein KGF55_004936 [Candida pseudojiufengensis]
MNIDNYEDNKGDDGIITTNTSDTITNLDQINIKINNHDNNLTSLTNNPNDSDSSLSSDSSSIQSSNNQILTRKTYSRKSIKQRANTQSEEDGEEEEEEESNENENDNENEENDGEVFQEVYERRQLIEELLEETNWEEGDPCFLISKQYLDKFLDEPVKSWPELVHKLGPIDSHLILDTNEQLYPENEEPYESYPVSEHVFRNLSHWFQILGVTVQRYFIINPVSGKLEIERWPINFALHQIGKKQTQSYFRNGNSRYSQPEQDESPFMFHMSKVTTFLTLIESIRYWLKLQKKPIEDFRLWFINNGTEISNNSIPYLITVNNFIFNIKNICVVDKSIYGFTLYDKGISTNRYENVHIVIEYKDKSNSDFPIDQYIKSNSTTFQDNNDEVGVGGHMGLSNLGNTCYMNSALQCLLHVPEINQYFFHNIYQGELNRDNPLGYNGDVANAFGSLLKQAFDPYKNSSSISPREFKSTIGRYSSMFSGYLQQDSQELLSWLLDALHEDLNRIYKKPYCEKPELSDEDINNSEAITKLADTCWHQHKQRNDSVIVDLFTGLYQSTLVCPDCEKTSITFDPFNDLTLPLPISKKWYHTLTIVDLSQDSTLPKRIMKLEVELNKTSNYEDLVNYLSKFLKIDHSNLFIYEIFQHGIYQDFQVDRVKNKFIPIGDLIREPDDIVVYIIPNNPEEDVILPVFNVAEDDDTSYRMGNFFGIPLFITLKKDQLNSFGTIRRKLLDAASLLSNYDLVDEYEKLKKITYPDYKHKEHYLKQDFKYLTSKENEIGQDENKGYDSDISIADPYISSEYGFRVKYIPDYSGKSGLTHLRGRNYPNINKHQSERLINVPLHKPALSDFHLLSDQLEEPKKSFYRYSESEYKNNEEQRTSSDEQMSASNSPEIISLGNSDKSDENEGFVVVGKFDDAKPTTSTSYNDDYDPQLVQQRPPPPLPLRNHLLRSSNSSDEETESENNFGNLFGSNSNLPEPPASNAYSESLKPSNVNSPLETNFYDEGQNNIQNERNEEQQQQELNSLVNKNSILLCEWDKPVYNNLFASKDGDALSNIEKLSNPELENNKAKYQKLKKAKITLDECLKSFSTPEILGEQDLWYCPRCKAHKRATKTIQLWSTGDILTIHLKRFHSARAFSDKIDSVVDFPIEGLDISSYVANPTITNGDCIYDLIAVDNHYGGLGGGHYTASVKNFRDNKWYYFNDSRVTEIEKPEEVISSAAYLLFYRKRSENNKLGGEKFAKLLAEGDLRYKYEQALKQDSITKVEEEITKYHKSYEDEEEQEQNEEEIVSQNDEINYDEIISNIQAEEPITPLTDDSEITKEVELQDLSNLSTIESSSSSSTSKKQRTLSKHGDDIVKRQKMSSSPIVD